MNDRRRLETYRFWHSRYFLESVSCRISSARSTLIAPDNFHPVATKTICRASWDRFQSSAKTSPSPSTNRDSCENAHLRMQREFMSLSRGGADGFAGAKVVKIRDIPFPDRCNVPASAKPLDIAAATRKLPYQLRVYEWQIVINSPRPDVELRARARVPYKNPGTLFLPLFPLSLRFCFLLHFAGFRKYSRHLRHSKKTQNLAANIAENYAIRGCLKRDSTHIRQTSQHVRTRGRGGEVSASRCTWSPVGRTRRNFPRFLPTRASRRWILRVRRRGKR